MRLEFNDANSSVRVIREEGDKPFKKNNSEHRWTKGCAAESAFWFHVRLALEKHFPGARWAKLLMYKDGHLVDDTEYYVRPLAPRRKADITSPTNFALRYAHHAVHNIAERFNEDGVVPLMVITELWEKLPDKKPKT